MKSYYVTTPGIVSRRNQDGTIILMRMDDAQFFYKISDVAAAVWSELEKPRQLQALVNHFVSFFPEQKDSLQKEIPAFIKKLEEKGLITAKQEGETSFRTEPFMMEKIKSAPYQFGDLQEFDLEQIETEVLNESVYLDVFAGSDLRLKENIQPLNEALSKVSQLHGVTFKWNKERRPTADTHVHAGLLAQDVASVMPELVRKDQESGLLAVEYSKLNSYLVEAIKELHQFVLRQEARIKSLEEQR